MLSSFSCASWPYVCLLWRNVYLGLLPIFWLGSFSILSCMSCLYILEINPLSVDSFANIFSHSEGCLFILFVVSFSSQKFLSFIRSHLFIFVFISITLGGGSKKILLWFMSKSVLPMFSSKTFIVSGLTFQSWIHFEFIFVYGVTECSSFILLHVAASFPSTTYWRDCLFSIVYPCLLCHRLVDHRCVGLSLGFLSCSIDLYFCFCASTILSWLL